MSINGENKADTRINLSLDASIIKFLSAFATIILLSHEFMISLLVFIGNVKLKVEP